MIMKFPHLNVYNDVFPFAETAVILDTFDDMGDRTEQRRKYKVSE